MPKKAVSKKKNPAAKATYDFELKFSEIPGQKEVQAQCEAITNQTIKRVEDCHQWLQEITKSILLQIKSQTSKNDAPALAPRTPTQERRVRTRTRNKMIAKTSSTAKSPHRITRNKAEIRNSSALRGKFRKDFKNAAGNNTSFNGGGNEGDDEEETPVKELPKSVVSLGKKRDQSKEEDEEEEVIDDENDGTADPADNSSGSRTTRSAAAKGNSALEADNNNNNNNKDTESSPVVNNNSRPIHPSPVENEDENVVTGRNLLSHQKVKAVGSEIEEITAVENGDALEENAGDETAATELQKTPETVKKVNTNQPSRIDGKTSGKLTAFYTKSPKTPAGKSPKSPRCFKTPNNRQLQQQQNQTPVSSSARGSPHSSTMIPHSSLKKTPLSSAAAHHQRAGGLSSVKRNANNWSSNGKSCSSSAHRGPKIGLNLDGNAAAIKCPPMTAGGATASSIEAKQKEASLKKEMLLKQKSETLRKQMQSRLERVRAANEARMAAKKGGPPKKPASAAEKKPPVTHEKKQGVGILASIKKPPKSKRNESLVDKIDIGKTKRRTLSLAGDGGDDRKHDDPAAESNSSESSVQRQQKKQKNYADELKESPQDEPPAPAGQKEEEKEKEKAVPVDIEKATGKLQPKSTRADSYDMTPLQTKKPSTNENYNIDDLNSGDETDDETCPRKTVPTWASGASLKAAIVKQHYSKLNPEVMFGPTYAPILDQMFRHKRTRFNKRTSSACWDSPLMPPPPAKRANL